MKVKDLMEETRWDLQLRKGWALKFELVCMRPTQPIEIATPGCQLLPSRTRVRISVCFESCCTPSSRIVPNTE